ncbi:MAG TPA: single-stranded DNA-binding protein [Anaerolineae bacterium]|nr:single-stranded DNA-binding protein [Anaerolineae bacterium]
MYQKIVIVGNLGRDPEMRYTPSGQAVTNFSVATTRKWSDGNGQTREETIWFRVATWGKLAEVCNQYLSKGRQVFVEGRLAADPQTGGPRVWQAQDGSSRASYEITALEVKFLGGRGDAPASYENGSSASVIDEPAGITEDEIPF